MVRPPACECVRLCCVSSLKQRDVFSCGGLSAFHQRGWRGRAVCALLALLPGMSVCVRALTFWAAHAHRSGTFRSKMSGDVLEPRGTPCVLCWRRRRVWFTWRISGVRLDEVIPFTGFLRHFLAFQSSLPEPRQKRIFETLK